MGTRGIQYITTHFQEQDFVLVTATPLEEMIFILNELNIGNCFKKVYGSPLKKRDAISQSLSELNVSPKEALLIGDSESDLSASRETGVNFLLRRNQFNSFLQASCESVLFDDLTNG